MPMMILALTLRLPRPWIWASARVVYKCAFFLMGIRVRARGFEKLDTQSPKIFMVNHVNLFDPFIFCCAFKKPIVGVEKRENFSIPIYGWVMRLWGMIPIARKDREQARKDLERAAHTLREDRAWVVMLPEGTRTKNGELGEFKKGAAHLALDTQIDVVPFTQHGAYHVKKRPHWRIRPGIIDIEIEDPIDPRAYDPTTLTEEVRELIQTRLNEGPKRLQTTPKKAIS